MYSLFVFDEYDVFVYIFYKGMMFQCFHFIWSIFTNIIYNEYIILTIILTQA